MRWAYTFSGTARDGAEWKTKGSLDAGAIDEAFVLARQRCFETLTEGAADPTHQAATCQGPYRILRAEIRQVV